MKGSSSCLVASAALVHSCACAKAFSSGLWQREERLRKLFAKKAEDFTVALELLQTSKVIYMNCKASRQNLQPPGFLLDQQCLHTSTPHPSLEFPALDTILHVLLVLLRYLWDESGIPYQWVCYWSFPCTTGLSVLGTTDNKKLLCPLQYHRSWPGLVLREDSVNMVFTNFWSSSYRKEFISTEGKNWLFKHKKNSKNTVSAEK